MSTTEVGRAAEAAVAAYLMAAGHELVGHNWRTKTCEIDVITTRNRVVYFVEVKYRHGTRFGDGLDAITQSKRLQMMRAAQQWVYRNTYEGDYRLVVAAVTGAAYQSIELRYVD